jgi:phospholipid transport system substrate-binding protein
MKQRSLRQLILSASLALAGTGPGLAAAPAEAGPSAPAPAVAPAPAAVAQADDPVKMLQGAVDEVLVIVYASPAPAEPLVVRVRPVLEKHFSFDLIARSAVGPAWKDYPADQQKKITELLAELVIRTYADRFDPAERPKITYQKAVETNATSRELPTVIAYAGKNYSVAYRVRRQPDGWRVYDVIIENISMVQNYRAQFDAIAQKGGAAAIVKALQDNLAQFANR